MATVKVARHCHGCGRDYELELDAARVRRWEDGEFVQDVWPEKTPGEREQIVTGTHDDCWDRMFGPEGGEPR